MSTLVRSIAEVTSTNKYEELLAQWGDMQAALGCLLHRPAQTHDCPAKVRQCDQWMQDLVAQDLDCKARFVAVDFGTMDKQVGRFVDDDEMLVTKKNGQRFRQRSDSSRRRE